MKIYQKEVPVTIGANPYMPLMQRMNGLVPARPAVAGSSGPACRQTGSNGVIFTKLY
ncbi:MAG: hypothetical protein IID16_08330 [Candidatus Marinimicrobia bacterium]|nr:hypothetical protein [Candidatus Neomarinimicrobiota bacterium]